MRPVLAATAGALIVALAGCGNANTGGEIDSRGPIDIWYSNNEQEVESLAVLHRPMWDHGEVRESEGIRVPAGVDDP